MNDIAHDRIIVHQPELHAIIMACFTDKAVRRLEKYGYRLNMKDPSITAWFWLRQKTADLLIEYSKKESAPLVVVENFIGTYTSTGDALLDLMEKYAGCAP